MNGWRLSYNGGWQMTKAKREKEGEKERKSDKVFDDDYAAYADYASVRRH